jgi:hypothetical protein
MESNMIKSNKSEAARFIQWNDGSIDARKGIKERSKDIDYIAGYRHGQHMMEMEAKVS